MEIINDIEIMEKQGYKYRGVIILDCVRYNWFSWPDNPDDDIIFELGLDYNTERKLKYDLKRNGFDYSGIIEQGSKEYITYTRNNGEWPDDIIQEISISRVRKRLKEIMNNQRKARKKTQGFNWTGLYD